MNSLSDFRLTLKWLHTTKTKTINEKNNINNLIGSSNRHKRALLLVGLANMQRIPGEVCCWFSRGKTSRSKGELRFSPLPKNKHFQTPIRPGIRWTKNHFVDVLPPNHHHHYYYYYYYYYCCCCFLKVTFHILGDRNWLPIGYSNDAFSYIWVFYDRKTMRPYFDLIVCQLRKQITDT